MRALLQHVRTLARVWIDGKVTGCIERGLVVFLGIARNDKRSDLLYLANKIPRLRLFSDEADKMNLSLLETQGVVLLISQVTLMAEVSGSGRRPSFSASANSE